MTYFLTYTFVSCISGLGTFQHFGPGWWSGDKGEHDGAAQKVYSLCRACGPHLLVWSAAQV